MLQRSYTQKAGLLRDSCTSLPGCPGSAMLPILLVPLLKFHAGPSLEPAPHFCMSYVITYRGLHPLCRRFPNIYIPPISKKCIFILPSSMFGSLA